ncbi:MAG TPA: LLM class flavin-dependent oxidoreductase [Achromobacter sp.]|uniref:LLM class flavin-dependent oxidoreductase n=1 Tax=Achromobacter sp. TaxID=134375 RepID=UPI002F95A537
MTAISVLDLMMIGEGRTFSDTMDGALALARHVEKHGFKRYWVAEHHNMPGIASSATTLIMSHLASGTGNLRIGSGGVMLPNHSPLIVAEQFATLDTMYPKRIDLGVGRAPGGDSPTTMAVRGGSAMSRDFAEDVQLLSDYLADNGRSSVRGVPGRHDVPIWILGSGMYGAALAARRGLPFAFASHFAPAMLKPALAHYRENFCPSKYLERPYVMAGVNVFAADTHEEAEFLASSHRQWVAGMQAGCPGLLPRPVEGFMDSLPEARRRVVEQELTYTAIGSPEKVGSWLREFIDYFGVDELMIDARIYDLEKRCRSYELAAKAILDLII